MRQFSLFGGFIRSASPSVVLCSQTYLYSAVSSAATCLKPGCDNIQRTCITRLCSAHHHAHLHKHSLHFIRANRAPRLIRGILQSYHAKQKLITFSLLISYNNYISWSIQMINCKSGNKLLVFPCLVWLTGQTPNICNFTGSKFKTKLTFEKLGPTNVWHFGQKCSDE